MKIEMAESLAYSYLKHVKKCLINQLNWKSSTNWDVSAEKLDELQYEFDKINRHHAFNDIFKSKLEQTLKQAEIDALGININENKIYAVEVAFHENGLQYGSKIETRNRIIKKLLRTKLTLEYYFPNQKYEMIFCSPKVNKATDEVIKEYFEILENEFKDNKSEYKYIANEYFSREILEKTIEINNDFDTAELFCRSVRLLKIADKLNSNQKNSISTAKISHEKHMNEGIKTNDINYETTVEIHGVIVPLEKNNNELFQEYIRKLMTLLFENKLIPYDEINKMMDKQYSKETFDLQFPILIMKDDNDKDNTGHSRYWLKYIFDGKYKICSQWWKDKEVDYKYKVKDWILYLKRKNEKGSI